MLQARHVLTHVRVLLYASVLALAGLVAFLAMRDTRAPEERVLARAQEAVMERDADTLLHLAGDDEVQALGLDAASLRRFLDDFVFDGQKDVSVAEKPAYDPGLRGTRWAVIGELGEDQHFSLGVDDSVDDPRLRALVSSLMFSRLGRGMVGSPTPRQRTEAHIALLEAELSTLEASGVTGVYWPMEGEASRTLTWRELIENRKGQLARIIENEQEMSGAGR